MNPSPPLREAELWRRVADAQDAAVVDSQAWRALERAVAARVASSGEGTVSPGVAAPPVSGWAGGGPNRRALGKLRHPRVLAIILGSSLLASAAVAVLVHASMSDRAGSGPRLLGALARHDGLPPPGSATAQAQTGEKAFVADARSDLPLRFTDGSVVTFRAGSAGRMQRLTHSGAEIVLERGWLEAHVVHADSTLWLVHAGPYRVRVTGTRFAMTWAAASFELDLYEGAVIIDGSVLGAGVPLRAGQRLKVASGVVLIEPLASAGGMAATPVVGAAAAPGSLVAGAASPMQPAATEAEAREGDPAAAATVGPSAEIAAVARDGAGASRLDSLEGASPKRRLRGKWHRGGQRIASAGGRGGSTLQHAAVMESTAGLAGRGTGHATDRALAVAGGDDAAIANGGSDWLRLAERGRYLDAFAAAKRTGWNALCRRLDARRLLTLGDVARYSGAQAEARQAFQAVVSRFPGDRLAADAVFSLGRLAFESSRPAEATRWFRRYVTDWPDAPLADQAAGRLVECAVRAEDRPAAQAAARRYLTRAPRGPHATLAREVLAQAEPGAPSSSPARLRYPPRSHARPISQATSRPPLDVGDGQP